MSKSYLENGVIWVPVAELAREYHKSRETIKRWIADGFILQMGYTAKRDPSGHWYVGKPIAQSSQSEQSANCP